IHTYITLFLDSRNSYAYCICYTMFIEQNKNPVHFRYTRFIILYSLKAKRYSGSFVSSSLLVDSASGKFVSDSCASGLLVMGTSCLPFVTASFTVLYADLRPPWKQNTAAGIPNKIPNAGILALPLSAIFTIAE